MPSRTFVTFYKNNNKYIMKRNFHIRENMKKYKSVSYVCIVKI